MSQNGFHENLAVLMRMTHAFSTNFMLACLNTETNPHEVDETLTARIVNRMEYLSENAANDSQVPDSMDATACEIIASLMDITRDQASLANLAPNFTDEYREAFRDAQDEIVVNLVEFMKRYDTV